MGALTAVAVLFGAFFVLLFAGVPISVSLGIASFATALAFLPWDDATYVIGQQMNVGIESFSLLAVPLFILAGNLMNTGGIARRLVDLALVAVGRVPGALAHTNVLANMLFGALSGSAVAAAAAIGSTLHERQQKAGYDPAFGAAVNVASAPTGLLIPPTTAAIVYSTVAGGVSVSALFMAGYVPGVLLGVVIMVIAFASARRERYPKVERVGAAEAFRVLLRAVPGLLLIVVVVGGIVFGVFTATEGAAVAVLYTLVLSLAYRSLSWAALKDVVTRTVVATGIVMFLIAASAGMSWVMAYTGIPAAITQALLSVADSSVVILVLMLVLLLVVGTFMDITPAILIFTPILLPIAEELGMDPVQFGMVLILAMCIGTMTPPVGSVLFVGTGVSGVSIERVVPKLLPYFVGLVLLLLAVTFVPALSLGLPGVMGLLD
ncbi:TRAP transporter large permease [Saccharopolyspora hordei]|uniref:Tripartite ATP-independent transporter DctM subunit n=1 Tax=Saccharopolyspora hordei TaxID=1838 RepID=A0A853AJK6_9PSEU|nr:TRAP transporter large permease [Saccharopolyspora hordei]NYI83956.1 tripartite ATP-independent transporter DctM subunit [Saccharopolyspora hordei]